MPAVLEIEGLAKTYRTWRGERTALNGLDMLVERGQVHGFLGPNGSGKTTTLKVLLGLVRPTGGRMRLLGQPVPARLPEVAGRVGAIVESPAFFGNFSGRRTLTLLATAGGVPRQRVDEVLDLVGMRQRADDRVKSYSLGMKQRLAVASALLKSPELLILDEPANGLDPAGIVAMREMLRHLASLGKTVFVSSHLLAEVRQMADVVGIIAAGRLVREGRMGEILGGEGVVRVRVQPIDVARATELLSRVGTPEPVSEAQRAAGWLAIRTTPDNGERVNRTLAESGLYASELHVGSDLEELFLSLTSGGGADRDGTFQSIATVGAGTGEQS